jgi:hypothetical protein
MNPPYKPCMVHRSRMGMRQGHEATQLVARDSMRSFLEQFGLHLVVEVTVVSLIDQVVRNTALSMVLGVGLVEGVQVLWQGWRKTNE